MKSVNRRRSLVAVVMSMIFCCTVLPIDAAALASDSRKTLLSEEIPEAIEQGMIDENGHVERLYGQETDLNTIVFGNANGTETAYVFDEPVKYVTSDGEIRDKSNSLYNLSVEGYAYVNSDNDIQTWFPSNLGEDTGIKVQYQGNIIEMYPYQGAEASAQKEDSISNAVYYDDVFGGETTVYYTPTFSGVKEDIVLYRHPTSNRFSFVLDCGELIPTIDNDVVVIQNPVTEVVVATVGSIYAYDSYAGEDVTRSHETRDNNFELLQNENGTYTLTLVVDEVFLAAEETVYPVYIDPTITVNASGSGSSKTILDTPIYNGSGVSGITAGSNQTAVVGYVGTVNGTQYGSGRLLMKFPGLMNRFFMDSYRYTITDATLYLSEGSGLSSTATITAYMYDGPVWSETSRYSYSLWNGVGERLSGYSYSYPNRTQGNFDITWAVQLWQSNHSLASRGIIFKNSNESSLTYYKTISTTEGNTAPYLSVTYATRTSQSGAYLSYGATSRNITIKLVGSTTTENTWKSIITNSCTAWNNSAVNMNFGTTTTGTSIYTLTVDSFADSWLGLTTSNTTGSKVNRATIQINTRTLSTSTLMRTSTVTHELGHLIWLEDYTGSTKVPSLMWHGRDREVIYTPQMMDVYHVLQKM